MAIYQGDQYSVPFSIKSSGDIVTPEEIEDVIIVLGNVVCSHKEGNLKYENGVWFFPLTREETSKMKDNTKCQVEVVYANNFIHSKVFDVKVKRSIDYFLKR